MLGTSAAQAAQFATTGAADVAFLPLSLTFAKELAGGQGGPGRREALPAHRAVGRGARRLQGAGAGPRLPGLRDRREGARHPRQVRVRSARRHPWTPRPSRSPSSWPVLTTAILLVLGLPLAWWLVTSRFRAKFLVEAVVALPLVLPPTVLGFYLLVGLGPQQPGRPALRGGGWATPSRSPSPGCSSPRSSTACPSRCSPSPGALAGVDRRLVEASHTLGVSRLATFFRVTLPARLAGRAGRRGADLRPHPGGVRRGAHGGRQHRRAAPAPSRWPSSTTSRRSSTGPPTGPPALLLAISFAVLALVYALQRRPFFRWNER